MAVFSELVGQTLVKVERLEDWGVDSEECIAFYTIDGVVYYQYHDRDCCESVVIDDICGDLNDLVGSPILVADESTEIGGMGRSSFTWTFYKVATIKGSVDIRWDGSSTGGYSESVNFIRSAA